MRHLVSQDAHFFTTNGQWGKTRDKAAAKHVHVPEADNQNTCPKGMITINLTYQAGYCCKKIQLRVGVLATPRYLPGPPLPYYRSGTVSTPGRLPTKRLGLTQSTL